jgi:diguanylate cyclase (GGDEF)-like protein/PAS domain S-box-containing protein
MSERELKAAGSLSTKWRVALGVAVVASVTYGVLPYSTTGELVLYDGPVVVAALAAFIGWKQRQGTNRLAAGAVATGLSLFLIAEMVWVTYKLEGRDPFPSVADAIFLAGYVALAVGAWALSAEHRKERDASAWIDAGILTLVAGLLVWQALLQTQANDTSTSGFTKAITMAYPLADLLVMGFALRFVLDRSAKNRAGLLFGLGILSTLVADFLFGWQDLRGAYESGSLVDVGWLLGYLSLGAAMLQPSTPSTAKPDIGLGRGRLAAVLLAVLVPQGVLFSQLSSVKGFHLDTATVALVIGTSTMLLISARMWGLLGRARAIERRRGDDRLSALIHHSADAVILIDRNALVSYTSPAAASLLDDGSQTLLGSDLSDWFVDESRTGLLRQLENLIAMPYGALVPVDGLIRSIGDDRTLVEGTGVNLLGDPNVAAIVVTLRDVTARRELESQLERRAFHDELTGLANRTLFSDRVTHALERQCRDPKVQVAVMFIDLDDFKAVNDGLGHASGDLLLRHVAKRLRASLRPADSVARFGGDEFAILLEDVSVVEAQQTADRILEVLKLPVELGEARFGVAVSIGLAFAAPESSVEELLRDADIAMYGAKAQGKGCAVLFDAKLRESAARRLSMKIELGDALAESQFRLVYQPIHNLTDKTIRGFEALLRWDHPTRGTVPPLDFIPVAEETGDIVSIGRWVLETACHQAVAWNERSDTPLTMSVNVSAVQFHHARFIGDLRDILRRTGLDGPLLTLELTESVLLEPERVTMLLNDIRDLGVGIAIDDFGTGYSSLSYLQQFPVTSVKIDRSFVSELSGERGDGLVRSIIAIADSLNLTTVAEGIETPDQLLALAGLNCGLAQGFHLSRPVDAAEIDLMLDQVVASL